MIKGVGRNEEIITNSNGGKQTKLDYDFTLIDSKAIFKLAEILKYGADKYEIDNWKLIPAREHLNHALTHAFAYLDGDDQDEHAAHFFCRAMMFLAKLLEENKGD
jgi:hypothetical protein